MARTGQTQRISGRLRALLSKERRVLNEAPTRRALPLVHPFPAPMSPLLAKTIIRKVTRADDVVLDPMAGSGTVAAAALELGRTCYAMDIDPLAVLVIRVQCGNQAPTRVQAAGINALGRAKILMRRPTALDELFKRNFDNQTRAFMVRWFPKKVRRGLIALWEAIRKVKSNEARVALKIAFSRVIIAKTAGTSYAIDVPHTRPHRATDKDVPDPLVMFPRRLRELVDRMESRAGNPDGAALRVRRGDVRDLPYRACSVDFVLTSSPYVNAIDYMRAHKFSLVWMGHSVTKLAALRAQMIGAEHGQYKIETRLKWLERKLPKMRGQLRPRVAILRRFFYDMETVTRELYRVLKPGGGCVFVLGQSYVSGHIIDTPGIIAQLAEEQGFKHLGTAYRDLNPHRRSLPFPRARGARGALGKRMDREAIVALVK